MAEREDTVEGRPKALNDFIMMEHLLDVTREPMSRGRRKLLVAAAVINGGDVLATADDLVRRSIAESFRETVKTDHNLAMRILSTFKASHVKSRRKLKKFLGYPAKGRMFPKR